MKKLFTILLIISLCLPMCFIANAAEQTFDGVAKTWLLIDGNADGPFVSKIILELNDAALSVGSEGVTLSMEDKNYEVGPAYFCDENGDPTDGGHKYVAFDVGDEITDGESSGFDPFSGTLFARDDTAISVWADRYQIVLNAEKFVLDGEEYQLAIDENCIGNRICPRADLFNYRNTFSGTYMNNYTGQEEEVSLAMAAYEPDSLAGGDKNPLIIWLHGQGEGGSDPDIAILGNEVAALAMDPIQSYFTAGDVHGAYVLVPQCKTYWMDEGDGTNGEGCGVSRYTEILKDTIDFYLQENPDVDANRIYIGGCSNGGYMTINMLINYPDMFAAAYPLCEAYSYYLFERDDNGDYVVYGDTQTINPAEMLEGDSEGESEDSSGDSNEEAEEETEYDPYDGISEGVSVVENESADPIVTKSSGEVIANEGLWFTEEKAQTIKDIPIWFVSSADDPTVSIVTYPLPTYVSLLQAGAEHVFMSLLKGYGHGVWQAFFQDKVTKVQDNEAFAAVEIPDAANARVRAYPIDPGADTGGSFDAEGFSNIFEWMNSKSR